MDTPSNQPSIFMRLASLDDAASIASVLYAAFIEYEALYTPAGFNATTPTSEQIQQRMHEGPVWVAIMDDAIVGTGSAVSKGEALYIRGMAVLPGSRGHRLGEALLKQIEDFGREHGNSRLFLSTTPFLSRAIRLYEKMGFRRCGDGPHDLFGTPLFTMEKPLVSP